MENLDDDEVQRLIQQQLKADKQTGLPGNDNDVQLYNMLFKVLAENPYAIADSPLADNLARNLGLRQENVDRICYHLMITAAILLILGITYAGMARAAVSQTNAVIQYFMDHKANCLFMVLSFIFIRLSDSFIGKSKASKNLGKINVRG